MPLLSIATMSPSVFAMKFGLRAADGCDDQVDDVKAWWDRVFLADRAHGNYVVAARTDPGGPRPAQSESDNHGSWTWSAGQISEALRRRSAVADRTRASHLWQARVAEAAAAAAKDDKTAAAWLATAARQRALAALAGHWSESAAHAATGGEQLVDDYNRRFAGLNEAVGRTRPGEAAGSKNYAA